MSLLRYIDLRPWEDNEDGQIDLTIDLLSDLVQQRIELKLDEDFSEPLTALILCLPCMESLDPETFLSAASVASCYLTDERFQSAILSHHQVSFVYDLLEAAAFRSTAGAPTASKHIEDLMPAQD